MPALIVGMALMSALTVHASARYGFFISLHLQQGIANASAQRANRINAYHTNTTDIPAALLVRMSRHIAPGHFGLGAATRIRAAADGRADIRAGASAGADMRIKAADVQHSRPDRSVGRRRHQERAAHIQICRHPHLPPLRPYRLPRADPQLTRPTYPIRTHTRQSQYITYKPATPDGRFAHRPSASDNASACTPYLTPRRSGICARKRPARRPKCA